MRLKQVLEDQPLFAFNCDDFCIYKGVVSALSEVGARAIVQISKGASDFWGISRFACLAKNESDLLFTNFDHARSLDTVKQVVDNGFSMVHIDGSNLSWQENIEITRKAVELAYVDGMLVEGEPFAKDTSPKQTAEFVDQTGVDLVAVFVGNRHGFDPKKEEHLDLNKLREIKQAVGEEVGLTLHGGSGVPKKEMQQALEEGLIVKVNINSQLRAAYKKALDQGIENYEGTFKVYSLMNPVVEAVKESVFGIIRDE